jgi:hypothetical protein
VEEVLRICEFRKARSQIELLWAARWNARRIEWSAPLDGEFMNQWTVFDRCTADAARGYSADVNENSQGVTEALDKAATEGRTVVLVVPAGPNRATVARITPPNGAEGD